jgi:hypothetical protein
MVMVAEAAVAAVVIEAVKAKFIMYPKVLLVALTS